MQIQSINHTTNFNGRIAQKAVSFIRDQGQHLFIQGTSFYLASKFVQPMDSLETFMRAKIFIDIGECLAAKQNHVPITTARQCTNIISALNDCSKDVIRWTKMLIDKINKG